VLKLYANISGTGTDVTVTLTMEGDYDSRLTINVLSSAFNLDRLSDVTISSPADDELLAYDSGSGKWTNQTPSEAGILAADGSVPLTADWDIGDGRKVLADQIQARDADGLKLTDDAGDGVFVADGGKVGIGTTEPDNLLTLGVGAGDLDINDNQLIFYPGNASSTTAFSLVSQYDPGSAGSFERDLIKFAPLSSDKASIQIYGGRTWEDGAFFEVYGDDVIGRESQLVFTAGSRTSSNTGNTGILFKISDNTPSTAMVMKITSDRKVGIGTASPGYVLDVGGDIHCTGKLTSDGGNDPPYVLYNYESRASIIERVKEEVLPDKLNGAVLFFNGDRGQLELFLPSKGEFRSLDGKVLEAVEPITQTFETEDRYYFDENTGEIKSYKVRKPARKYRLKPDHELDPLTGKVKRKIKEKKKDPETGEEIEEIVGEEEVAPEEAIELVKEDGR